MSSKFEDVVEKEVRRRYADLLASAGVNSGRLSLEVLYLLPEEFVREYVELFHQAMREDISAPLAGDGVVIAKAGEIKKRQAKEKVTDDSGEVREVAVGGSDRGAQSGGKRYRNHWLVKDELALEVKRRVDRKLLRIIAVTRGDVKRAVDGAMEGDGERDSSGRFKS